MKTGIIKSKYQPLKKNKGFKNQNSILKKDSRKFQVFGGMRASPFFLKARASFKKSPKKTPRKILDDIISKCVRLAAADSMGMVICVTCGRSFHWKTVDCGHFQKREHTKTRYDLRNLGPQCEDCNRFKDGENEIFAEFIDRKHGVGTADKLRALARETERYYPYEEEIAKWKKVLKKLVEERGNQINY